VALASSVFITTMTDVFGFAPGDDYKLASHEQIVEYFHKLDAASDRIVVEEIGKSSEGRPMSADCCGQCHLPDPHRGNRAYRRVLWAVLAINAVMFLVEIGAGVAAGSASLQADALDFLGDAANYVISLLVVGMALRYRATAALAKACPMGVFGLWVVGTAIWHAALGTLPSAFTWASICKTPTRP